MWKRKEEGVEKNPENREDALERAGDGCAKHQANVFKFGFSRRSTIQNQIPRAESGFADKHLHELGRH
jgi:hypothetical protein